LAKEGGVENEYLLIEAFENKRPVPAAAKRTPPPFSQKQAGFLILSCRDVRNDLSPRVPLFRQQRGERQVRKGSVEGGRVGQTKKE
jgi:hypothetical protein